MTGEAARRVSALAGGVGQVEGAASLRAIVMDSTSVLMETDCGEFMIFCRSSFTIQHPHALLFSLPLPGCHGTGCPLHGDESFHGSCVSCVECCNSVSVFKRGAV